MASSQETNACERQQRSELLRAREPEVVNELEGGDYIVEWTRMKVDYYRATQHEDNQRQHLSIYIIKFLHADSISLTPPRARHSTLRKLL